jgi:hypothetical protein
VILGKFIESWVKKKNKTDARELKVAKSRMNEYEKLKG